MLPHHGHRVERREEGCLSPHFYIDFSAEAADEFRVAAYGRKHAGEKQEIPGLNGLHIHAEWFRRFRKLDAEFFQPFLGAGHHRHTIRTYPWTLQLAARLAIMVDARNNTSVAVRRVPLYLGMEYCLLLRGVA